MKLIASAALIAAMLGTAAVAPAAFAQDQVPQAGAGEVRHQMFLRHHGGKHRFGPQLHIQRGSSGIERPMMRRGGGLLMLACSGRGADRLEHLLLSLSQRLDPTPEQQPLFDDFRAAALTAQTGFAESCAELRPQGETAAAPDLVERFETGIAIGEARLAAMNEVLPALEALYGGLTDEQKALLEPGHGMRGNRHGMRSTPPMPPAAPAAPELEG